MEKIIKNHAKNTPDAVGNPVVNAACTCRDQGFLHDFGEGAESDADEKHQPKRLFPVGLSVFTIRFAVSPKRDVSERQIHNEVDDFVQPDGGLHFWE